MTPLTMLKIAEKSAHCMRTAIDRFDWRFYPDWNVSRARVWYESGRIIDITDRPVMVDDEYSVAEIDPETYKVIEEYDDEDWEYYMYQKDLENAEIEEEMYFDSMPDWGDEFYES